MWKILFVAMLVGFAFLSSRVMAYVYLNVTITATPQPSYCISNMSVEKVSRDEIRLCWTPGTGSGVLGSYLLANTNHYPQNHTDGVLVYQGSDNCTNYIFAGLDERYVFIKAWSYNASDVLEVCGTTVLWDRGLMIFFLGMVGISLGLTFTALRGNLLLMRIAAALVWLAMGLMTMVDVFGLDLPGSWNIILGYAFLMMCFAVFLLQMDTEIMHEAQGHKWVEWGPSPEMKGPSGYEHYRNLLRGRTGTGRPRRRR